MVVTGEDLGGDDGALDHGHAEGEGGETNGTTLFGTCDDGNQMDGKRDHLLGEGLEKMSFFESLFERM